MQVSKAEKELGFSKKQIASCLGVHYQTIVKWNRNKKPLSKEHLEMLGIGPKLPQIEQIGESHTKTLTDTILCRFEGSCKELTYLIGLLQIVDLLGLDRMRIMVRIDTLLKDLPL